MKYIFVLSLLLSLVNCSKPKTVLICGDHICINKAEAKQYFEENLTIEVKILENKSKKDLDLVELNLNKDVNGKREVRLIPKKETNKKLKKLTNKEIDKIKENIQDKKKKRKITIKNTEKKEKIVKKKMVKKKGKEQKENKPYLNINNIKRGDKVDVCTLIENCSIEEISKFLVEQGKKKKFPDISKK